MAQHISWSQGRFTSLFCRIPPQCEPCLTVLSDSQVCCRFWAVLLAQYSVAVLSAFQPYNSHFKVQIASSHRNSSTPVPPLGTPFNTISCFSDQMAYLSNMPWCSRQISIKEAIHLQGLLPVQSNLARQFRLFLAQVSSLQTMILIGRMLPLLILLLT